MTLKNGGTCVCAFSLLTASLFVFSIWIIQSYAVYTKMVQINQLVCSHGKVGLNITDMSLTIITRCNSQRRFGEAVNNQSREATKSPDHGRHLLYFGTNKDLAKRMNTEKMLQKYTDPKNSSLARRFPTVICVGVAKAGTTILRVYLSLHPQVVTFPEEAWFFSKPDALHSLERYLKIMPYSKVNQITFEKSPNYAVSRTAVNNIHTFDPSVKVLLAVRDPIARAMSGYLHRNRDKIKRKLSVPSFEELAIVNGVVNSRYQPVKNSVYSFIMKSWLTYFGREQIFIIDGDNMISNPVDELKKVENFLGLDHHLTEDVLSFHAQKGLFCFETSSQIQFIGRTCAKRHPEIRADVIHKLKDYYRPYNEKFFKLAGQNFSWNY